MPLPTWPLPPGARPRAHPAVNGSHREAPAAQPFPGTRLGSLAGQNLRQERPSLLTPALTLPPGFSEEGRRVFLELGPTQASGSTSPGRYPFSGNSSDHNHPVLSLAPPPSPRGRTSLENLGRAPVGLGKPCVHLPLGRGLHRREHPQRKRHVRAWRCNGKCGGA